ncbi:MAG: HEAT repeat domain-containing protein [Bacteroidales bacterium]|nr:HEAT repeat domain-containing protein [Bacteroidales bacterium]
MVRVKIIFMVISLTFFSTVLNSQTLLNSKFIKNSFSWELTFENKNDFTIFVDKVGAISQVNFGEFNCKSGLWIPDPISDFVVNVPAKSDTTFIGAKTLLGIEPGEIKSFTVAVVPDVTPACGLWAMDLSVLVKFHYGYTFQSAPEMIVSRDIVRFSYRVYSDEELPVVINDPDPEIRITAIKELKLSYLDDKTIQSLVTQKLHDDDINVRLTAIMAVNDMKLMAMSEQLNTNLLSANERDEITTLIRVIGKLKSTDGANILIEKLINGNIEEAKLIAKTLIEMDNPDIPAKVRLAVEDNKNWASGNEIENDKLGLLSGILINYKDIGSIQLLKDILDKRSTDPKVKSYIIAYLAGMIETYQLLQDEFILSFKEEYADFLYNRDEIIRYNSLNLYLASDFETKRKSKVIRKSLKDSKHHIKYKAAVWAGKLGFDEYATDIKSLYSTEIGRQYQEMADSELKFEWGDE